MVLFFTGGKNAITYSGELREDNDIKQETVAKHLSVSQATYSRYETGEIEIPLVAIETLASYYGTSVDYLLGRTGEKTAYKPLD